MEDMDGVRRRNIQLFLSRQSQIIDPVQLNDLLKALERFGIKLPALPWRSLGERLGVEKGTLDDIEMYFTALKTVMDIMGQRMREDEYIDCLRECLFVWLDRNERATLSSLISALYNMAEEAPDNSAGVLLAVDAMIGYYVLKRFIDDRHCVLAKWTAISFSGPKDSEKKKLINLLLNLQGNPGAIVKEEVLLVSKLLTGKLENNSEAMSFAEVILNTSNFQFSRYFFCSPTQPTQYELLEETVCKLLQVQLSPSYLKQSLDNYSLLTKEVEELKSKVSLLHSPHEGFSYWEQIDSLQRARREKRRSFWRLHDIKTELREINSQFRLKNKILKDISKLLKQHSDHFISPTPISITSRFTGQSSNSDVPVSFTCSIPFTAGFFNDVMKLSTDAPVTPSFPIHLISIINTGGSPAISDIVPSLFCFVPVNIIVHNLKDDLESLIASSNLTHQETIESTVRSLNSLMPPANAEVMMESNFAVVGTHYTNTPEFKEEVNEKNYRIKSKLIDFGEYILRYGSSLIFPVNAEANDEYTQKISKALSRKISKYYIEDDIPVQQLLFIMELIRLKNHQLMHISQCIEIGKSLNMNSREVESVLKFCHQLSIILYFSTFLGHIVFLDPQYLLSKLSDLYNISHQSKTPGLIDASIIADVFSGSLLTPDDAFNLLVSLHLAVITPDDAFNLLVCLHLAVRIDTLYFLPYTLQRVSNDEIKNTKRMIQSDLDPLVLTWDIGQIPQSIFPTLIVLLIRKYGMTFDTSCLNRNIIILEHPSHWKFMLVDVFHWLEVYCISNERHCLYIKDTILAEIRSMASIFNYKESLSSPTLSFLCTTCKDVPQHTCVINEETDVAKCRETNTSFLINSQRQRPWFHHQMAEEQESTPNRIKNIDVVPTILKEASFRSRKWMRLGEKLGISKEALDNVNGDSIPQCLQECLAVWAKEKSPTWKDLIDALNAIGEAKAAEHISLQL